MTVLDFRLLTIAFLFDGYPALAAEVAAMNGATR
jgi:hypothetical protein